MGLFLNLEKNTGHLYVAVYSVRYHIKINKGSWYSVSPKVLATTSLASATPSLLNIKMA